MSSAVGFPKGLTAQPLWKGSFIELTQTTVQQAILGVDSIYTVIKHKIPK